MSPQAKYIRDLLQALVANRNPTQASLEALRRLANQAVDFGVDHSEACANFIQATIAATRTGSSLAATRLLALPPDEAARIIHFRIWQHGAQLARTERRHARHHEQTVDDNNESNDIETDLRRHHDAPLVARDLKEALGPDLLRLLRFRLHGLGFVAIAEQENIATSTVHARVQNALSVLKAHANRTGTSEETGRLALLLLAA